MFRSSRRSRDTRPATDGTTAARVGDLLALGRLDEAERAARAGLEAEPRDAGLLTALAAELLQADRPADGLAAGGRGRRPRPARRPRAPAARDGAVDASAWAGPVAVGLCLATLAPVVVTGWQVASAALAFVLGGGALALLHAVAVFAVIGTRAAWRRLRRTAR